MKKYFLICGGISVALFATALTVSLVKDSQNKKDVQNDLKDLTNDLQTSKAETTKDIQALDASLKEAKDSLNALVSGEVKKLETALEQVKTELKGADKDLTTKLTALETELKNADTTNATAISDLKASFEAFCNDVEANYSTKADVTSAIATLRGTLEAADAANLTTMQNLISSIETKIASLKTSVEGNTSSIEAIQSTVSALETTVNSLKGAMSTDNTELRESLLDLATQLNNHASEISDINTWLDNFAGEEMINAKAVKVGDFYDFCSHIKVELKDTLLNKLYDGAEATSKYEEISTEIDHIYQQGVVRISLASTNEELDTNFTNAKTEVNEIVEEFRVAVYKQTINDSFEKYRNSTLSSMGSMNITTSEYATFETTIKGVKLADYTNLETSDDVKQVLLDAMFEVYKVHTQAWVIDSQSNAVEIVNGFENLTDAEKASYVNEIKNVVLSDNFAAIKRQKNDVDDNVTNVETNKDVTDEKANVTAKIEAYVQLAENQDKETAAKNSYYAARFVAYNADDDALQVEDGPFDRYLSAEVVQEAKAKYESIIAKYDYSVANTSSAADLKTAYAAEVDELGAAMYEYEYKWKLNYKQENADKDFEEYKETMKQKVATYSSLTTDEIKGYQKMIDVVKLPDVSIIKTLEEIDEVVKQKTTLVNNVDLLASFRSGEIKFISEHMEIYEGTNYVAEFSAEELKLATDRITAIDAKYIYSIDGILGLTDTDILAKVESYTTDGINKLNKDEAAELKDLQDKFYCVLDTREKTQDMVDDINRRAEAFGDAVANDFGFDIRVIGEFDIGSLDDPMDRFTTDSKNYLDSITSVYNKAIALHTSITAANTVADTIRNEYRTVDGLTQNEVDSLWNEIYSKGYDRVSAKGLYNAMNAQGADANVVLATYDKEISDIATKARNLYETRVFAYSTDEANLQDVENAIATLNERYNNANNPTKFNSTDWANLTNELRTIFNNHKTFKVCETKNDVTNMDAKFATALENWKTKVDNEYKNRDENMLANTIASTTVELEAYIQDLRNVDANKPYDLRILELRNEYVALIEGCDYSYEVSKYYQELKTKLEEILPAQN